jgi:hypothetical protein
MSLIRLTRSENGLRPCLKSKSRRQSTRILSSKLRTY